MKRVFLFIIGILLLYSCEILNDSAPTINKDITAQYLVNGNLETYIQNNEIVRFKGKPGITPISIGSADLTKFEPCFVLHIENGTTSVSSAIIKLDNLEVLNTSDFSKNAGKFTFEICNLTLTSVLTVELRGAPGSYLNIWIEGRIKNYPKPIVFNPDLEYGLLTDIDENTYKTIQIGTQIWMAENLRTTKYNDNSIIPLVTDNSAWIVLTTPGYCWYNNDKTNKEVYGALYNWFTVNTGKLCPLGWHVPDNSEWTTLIDYSGGTNIGGGKLKETNDTHWRSPNINSTNETGFTGLPGGNRDLGGPFYNIGDYGYWWSATEATSTNAWYKFLFYNDGSMISNDYGKTLGYSVRCIKD